MKSIVGGASLCAAMLSVFLASGAPAMAKGCIKGAIVGGIAGHYAGGHGTVGALGGCVIGRHEADKRARAQQPAEPRRGQGQR